MFAISQATEVGIIAATGGVNLFLAVMMLTMNKEKNKKGALAEDKEISQEAAQTEEKKSRKDKKLFKKTGKKAAAPKETFDKPEEGSLEHAEAPVRKEPSYEPEKREETSASKQEVFEKAPEPEEKKMTATLSIIERSDAGDRVKMTAKVVDALAEKGEYKIGGRKTSDYVVSNQFISGTHAIISKRDGRYYIMDVSRNGTQISAIPYRNPGQDLMMYRLEIGKEEELLDRTVISLAGKVELIFMVSAEN